MSSVRTLRAGNHPLRMLFTILAMMLALSCAAIDNVPRPIYEPIFLSTSTPSVYGGQAAALSTGSGSPAAQDTTYTVTTSHPALFVNMPSTVVVPQGCLSASWSATTCAVSSPVTVTITTTANGASSSTTVTIWP